MLAHQSQKSLIFFLVIFTLLSLPNKPNFSSAISFLLKMNIDDLLTAAKRIPNGTTIKTEL